MPSSLPIAHTLPEIRSHLRTHTRLILQAPPGAGKTTMVPLALMDEPWLEGKRIVMLEPRRLAVRASAARMAQMLGERVGERVGYRIRMDRVESEATRVLIVTEGILTRMIQHDPELSDVGLVIFDEYHERSLHADLSLALTLESQEVLREDLRILIMSATLNTAVLAEVLSAPVVQSEGRSYPVTRRYLDPAIPLPTRQTLSGVVADRVRTLLGQTEGSILVFLPGVREIKRVEQILLSDIPSDTRLAPLYGNLTKAQQDRAIAPPPPGKRKVVLATNIAQTSLTIEGITSVVDSGLQNVSVFNPLTGMNRLTQTFISADAATQRAGRAGRLSAGEAHHLWHRSRLLAPHDTPEILQADLTPLVLELALWGTDDPATLTWLDTPSPTAITHARELLRRLGAIDEDGTITPHGRAMIRLSLHPRLAHMILRAQELGLGYEASLLATLLSERDIFPATYRHVDIRERVEALHRVATGRNTSEKINLPHARELLKSARRIEPDTKNTIEMERLGVLLGYAYPERIARQRQTGSPEYLIQSGQGARLPADDPLTRSPWIVIADLDARTTHAAIYKAVPIDEAQITEYFSDQITEQEELEWSEAEERVEVRHVQRLGSILLSERPISAGNHPEAVDLLMDEIARRGLEPLPWDKRSISLRDRVAFLHHHGEEFPDLSSTYLLEHLEEWLSPYLLGITSLRGLAGLDLYGILLGLLTYPQTQTLDRLAPARLTVPSGSRIPIDYRDPDHPILAVRMQEMFGMPQTPTLLDGRLPLTLHLLSPASRPMQVTTDLASFWAHTYTEVKKELQGRYPKHHWPDDPLEATATNRAKRRK